MQFYHDLVMGTLGVNHNYHSSLLLGYLESDGFAYERTT